MITNISNNEKIDIKRLNMAIKSFHQVHPITDKMTLTYKGVSRLVMLDRYAFKDISKATLSVGDLVVLTVKADPNYPTRGTGFVKEIDYENHTVQILIEEEYRGVLEQGSNLVTRDLDTIEKPLEVYYEQIAKRNATGLSAVENGAQQKESSYHLFYHELMNLNFIPAGRVLYGAGSDTEVTYFNCYVMPFIPDSRGGISDHRKKIMEIMSRGGGVGTNGSTLRPRNTLVQGVNGKSSGSVSWLNDIAQLTHLVEQGGSRRGAQMIMLSNWHPDIIEFIISKMQNPRILRYLIEHTKDTQIKNLASEKLSFTPFTENELAMYQNILNYKNIPGTGGFDLTTLQDAEDKIKAGGTYGVHNPDFLSGANISICLTDDFMRAVDNDEDYALRFPAVESYSETEMSDYDTNWSEVGDVREWEASGRAVRTYRTIKARELWNLINICATYSAEPGIFFIDNANEMTNAKAYGQKVVATNPCGEQPLAPYSVCNLAAINLAEMVGKDSGIINYHKLRQTIKTGIRMQDNVIDATPYFLEENEKQALGERRIGLGIMGLADLLIYAGKEYGSTDGNELVDQLFETIAVTAYESSIELAKEKGSFPFLIGKTNKETAQLRENFISTGYMKQMPEHIRQDILTYGIRNSHLLTVAPTGSTGTMVGVSTGLEPYFSFSYFRSGRLGKFIEVKADIVQDYLNYHPEADENNLPSHFVSSMDLEPEAHVDVQCIIQRWVDSSISKTVNAPRGYNVEQVQSIYERLYKKGAKGGTVYVDGSRDSQVLTLEAEENNWEADLDYSEKVPFTSSTVESTVGTEVGDTCPICRQGTVENLGGCNTCTNCNAQLRCGL